MLSAEGGMIHLSTLHHFGVSPPFHCRPRPYLTPSFLPIGLQPYAPVPELEWHLTLHPSSQHYPAPLSSPPSPPSSP